MSRVVLVTGCSTGGIGFALCEEFARQGCKVYATSRNVETVGQFKNPGIKKFALDVTSDESVQRVVQHIAEIEGKIDVVVNNAGLVCPGPLIDQSLDDVRMVFETNTFAILRVAKAVIPLMAKRRSGVIVNIGSIVGEFPTPWNGIYCASKAALHSISDVLSMECKPLNISVLLIAAGGVKSNISANGHARFRLHDDTLYAAYLPNIIDRINSSQGPNSMPTEKFANAVVSKALHSRPPTYMSLGDYAWLFAIFKWIPKSWAFFVMWRKYSRKIG